MDAYVEPHLTWGLLTESDLPDLHRLREQIAALDNSVLSSIATALDARELFVPEGQAVGGRDAYHSLSAYGINYVAAGDPLQIYIMGGVHPTHRHLSIGTALFHWQISHAIAWRDEHQPGTPVRLSCYAEIGRVGLEAVARLIGFEPTRYYYDLARDFHRPVAVPTIPGVSLRAFEPEDSETVRRLHNLCFSTITSSSEVGPDAWSDRIAEETFRPGWSVLAIADGQVVGYAMSGVDETSEDGALYGWTERFGVHPQYRGRGIAIAMLAACLKAMRDDGCVEAGIGIDTADQDGITRLTGELGYTTRDAVALLTKWVP